jgi:predicted nucleotidyltransferase component of viral defense system
VDKVQEFYVASLYPLQDRVLQSINQLGTGFYLTGGTALSRAYLQHRYSDDLDLFVNYDARFSLWAELIVNQLVSHTNWRCEITIRQEFFVRILLLENDITLKIELVNDVPSRVGEIRQHPQLSAIDSPENILANKLSALIGRDEPRDIADVWGLCTKMGLSIENAIEGANSKAAGIYPLDIARKLLTVTQTQWALVRWIDPPDLYQYISELKSLGEKLILAQ